MKTPLTGSMKLILRVLVFALMIIITGCAHYFKVTAVPDPKAEKLNGFIKQGKVLILYYENEAWTLEWFYSKIKNKMETCSMSDNL